MSTIEEGLKQRRSRLRALTTLVAAVAALAGVVAGVPTAASAQGKGGNGLPEDVEAMKEAFEAYVQSVEAMADQFVAAEAFTLDDAHSVGAYDLISGFLNSTNRSQLTSSGSGRRGYPRFAGFDDPDTRIGVDNPDTQYMGTIISNLDCQGVWRIFGNRSNTVDFILTTFDTSSGVGGGPTLEDEDMKNLNGDPLQVGDDFEVYASCPDNRDPAWDNWLELFPSEQIQIARRQSACDWAAEAPGEIHIERVGTRGVPSAPLDPAVMTEQILDGKAILDVQGPFWPAFVDSIRNNIPVNTATPWRPTGGLGITTQLNMLMWFELADGEALVIRLPDEDPRIGSGVAGYYGLQISNFWGSSADWANRHVSLSWGLGGSCQAEQATTPTPHPAQQFITANGGPACGFQRAYYVVVSKQDPGVRNWVETADLSQGIIAGRLQSVDPTEFPAVAGLGSCMLPVAFTLPTAAVQGFLGQLGATPYGPAERATQLEGRQDYVRDKYIFW